jgi:exoribonuclease-2
LFPKSLMFSGRPGFSLSSGKENRVLTFSAKINESGELVDCVVSPGIARNFVKLSYEEVDLALSGKVMERYYPFGRAPALPPTPQLPASQLDDLRTMSMLRYRIVQHRNRVGIIDSGREQAEIMEFVTPQNIESPTMRPSEFRGFPEFTYYVMKSRDTQKSARGVVAEAMKLACRTAARWCAENGVETLYRTTSPLLGDPEALEMLRGLRDDEGLVDLALMNAHATQPMAAYSLTPGAHWALAIPEGHGYTRATSPLRRFSDLMVHYQIHRRLLGAKPHFDTAYLRDYKDWLAADDRLKKRTENLHLRSWVLIALKRWMEAPRTDIPDPLVDLHAVLMRPPKYDLIEKDMRSEVRIPALGIAATLINIPYNFFKTSWEISRSVPIKVNEIRLGTRPSLMVTLR